MPLTLPENATEHEEQRCFVAWFRRNFPGVLIFAVPNGGRRSKSEAARLKLEGVVPGIPDLYVPAWQLWIEMKRNNGGRASKDQQAMVAHLRSLGHRAEICHGAAHAMRTVCAVARHFLRRSEWLDELAQEIPGSSNPPGKQPET